MEMEATYIELLTTVKIGMGEYIFKGQRFRKPFPEVVEKEFRTNPKAFLVLNQEPPSQSHRILSKPQYKGPIPTSVEPSTEDLKAFKKQGELAHQKAEEVREVLDRMFGEEEEPKPTKKRRLPI